MVSVAEPLLNLIRNISGNTRVVGLIGWPVEHSLSPAMHNAAFKKLGLDYVYVPFPVEPGNFREAVLGLPKLGVLGVNITIPYKEEALRLTKNTPETSKFIGAVNTLVIRNASIHGANTDYEGFRIALSHAQPNLRGKNAVVIGAGGAARAIVYELARQVKNLCIINRSRKKAERLIRDMRRWKLSAVWPVECEPGSDIARKKISEADLLVNATSLGMYSGDPMPVDPTALHKGLFVFDVVYNRETELLKCARKIGAKAMGGLEMLVYQGAKALELWTNPAVTVEDIAKIMRKAALTELKKHAQ